MRVPWHTALLIELLPLLLRSVATVLVQHGELKRGQVLVAGEVWGKIRTLLSDSGKPVERAGPSTPVLTAGWRQPPMGGELCLQVTPPTSVLCHYWMTLTPGGERRQG